MARVGDYTAISDLQPDDVFRMNGSYFCLSKGEYYRAKSGGGPGNFSRGKRVDSLPANRPGQVQVVAKLHR